MALENHIERLPQEVKRLTAEINRLVSGGQFRTVREEVSDLASWYWHTSGDVAKPGEAEMAQFALDCLEVFAKAMERRKTHAGVARVNEIAGELLEKFDEPGESNP